MLKDGLQAGGNQLQTELKFTQRNEEYYTW